MRIASPLPRRDRELIAAFVDGRDDMAETDLARLVERCRTDRTVLTALDAALADEALIYRQLAPASRGFAMRVVQEAQRRRQPKAEAGIGRRRIVLAAVTMAVSALVAAGLLWSSWPAEHAWYLWEDGRRQPLDLPLGARWQRDTPSTWEHDDGTRLAIAAGARLTLRPDGIGLLAGTLSVAASARAADDPLAFHLPEGVVQIVGTRFQLQVDDQGSQIRVDEGRVRFRQHGTGLEELIGAGGRLFARRADPPVVGGRSLTWSIAVGGRRLILSDPQAVSPSYQDTDGDLRSIAGGRGIELRANTWKAFPMPSYTVTPDTVLECTYTCLDPGEIHAIGLLDPRGGDFHVDEGVMFQLAGEQKWGIDLGLELPIGEPRLIRIPLGAHYQGPMTNLAVGCDDDAGDGSACRISDLRLFEP